MIWKIFPIAAFRTSWDRVKEYYEILEGKSSSENKTPKPDPTKI